MKFLPSRCTLQPKSLSRLSGLDSARTVKAIYLMGTYSIFSLNLMAIFFLTGFGYLQAESQQWKITSDSSSLDIANQTYQWSGNAHFSSGSLSISGDEIKEIRSLNGDTRQVSILGSPASFEQQIPVHASDNLTQLVKLAANKIAYDLNQQQVEANGDVSLMKMQKDDDYFLIAGSSLELVQKPHLQVAMTGSPLKIVIQQPEKPAFNATASSIEFDEVSHIFTLSGDVELNTGREKITAEKILFDSQSQRIEIPKADSQQVNMIKEQEKMPADNESELED